MPRGLGLMPYATWVGTGFYGGWKKDLSTLHSRTPKPRTTPLFAALSAFLLRSLRIWKNSILWKEETIFWIFLIIFLRCNWDGREFSARSWIKTLEPPNTIISLIPWVLAIWIPYHNTNASAMLLVSLPNSQEKLNSDYPFGVMKTPLPLLPQIVDRILQYI